MSPNEQSEALDVTMHGGRNALRGRVEVRLS